MSVAARCREVGSALVIDATQSLGALPLDLAAIRPDFLACAGYKWLLGPYSLGYLYVAPRWQDGRPLEHNWIARTGSENFAGLVDYQDGYQPGARRFDVGERANFGLMPAGIAGLEQLLRWGQPAIIETLAARTADIVRARVPWACARCRRSCGPGIFWGCGFPAARRPGCRSGWQRSMSMSACAAIRCA